MSHGHDWVERVRRFVLPRVGLLTQWLEDTVGGKYYMVAELHNNQFVGRVPMPEEEFEEVLHDLGFERNPMASFKRISTGEREEGSWRLVGINDDDQMQLHVIIYDGDKQYDAGDTGYTYVYAHQEMRWDTNPIKHLQKVRANGPKGAKYMKRLLDEYGVNHEPIRP